MTNAHRPNISWPRGYFGIGIYHTKTEINVGTLMRSAFQLGAAYVYTIGRRYQRQASDTTNAAKMIPLYHYENWLDFVNHTPLDCPIIGIEMGGRNLVNFVHPERACYLLGAEDTGLPDEVLNRCWATITIPSIRMDSYNVAVAGSIIMYDRLAKSKFGKESDAEL